MKRILFITVLFFASILSAQQMAFNFIEITVEPNSQDQIAELFDEFMDGKKFNSGGMVLERLRHGRKDGRTHRIVWMWEIDNGGFAEKLADFENDAFWRGLFNFVESWGDARSGRILNWKEGDAKKNPWVHIWDIKAKDPKAFASAQKKFTESASALFTDRVVGFGTYDVNKPNGASHWALVTGKNLNDHLGFISEVQDNKAFKVYVQNRGEVEQTHDFVVEVLRRYQ